MSRASEATRAAYRLGGEWLPDKGELVGVRGYFDRVGWCEDSERRYTLTLYPGVAYLITNRIKLTDVDEGVEYEFWVRRPRGAATVGVRLDEIRPAEPDER